MRTLTLVLASIALEGCTVPVRVVNAPELARGEVRAFFDRASSTRWSLSVDGCAPAHQLWQVSEVKAVGVVLRQQSESGTAVCDLRYGDVTDINDFPPGTADRPKRVQTAGKG